MFLNLNGDFLVRLSNLTNEETDIVNKKSTNLLIALLTESGIENIRLYQEAEVYKLKLNFKILKIVNFIFRLMNIFFNI